MPDLRDAEAPASLLDRVQARYNGLVSSAGFRRWAAAFPLTRPIARRRARQTFDLCAGFVYSQILYACVRLHLFEILANGPVSAEALSRQVGLPLESTLRLLDAAVSLRLLAPASRQRYQLGALGAPLVDNASITSMVEHHALLYSDLRDPITLLRSGGQDTELGRYWPYAANRDGAGLSSEAFVSYTKLMSASQPLVADEILDAHDFSRHRCILDVGGGEGTFLLSVAARHPDIRLQLFDLPQVAQSGRDRFVEHGIADRSSAIGGNFLIDPLPRGADLVTLVRVLHDHDDASVLALLKSVRRVLPTGGTLLIAEPMSATPGAAPVGDAYFGFYLLAMGRGRPRTPRALMELLGQAGFRKVEIVPTRMPLQTSVIRAVVRKPGH